MLLPVLVESLFVLFLFLDIIVCFNPASKDIQDVCTQYHLDLSCMALMIRNDIELSQVWTSDQRVRCYVLIGTALNIAKLVELILSSHNYRAFCNGTAPALGWQNLLCSLALLVTNVFTTTFVAMNELSKDNFGSQCYNGSVLPTIDYLLHLGILADQVHFVPDLPLENSKYYIAIMASLHLVLLTLMNMMTAIIVEELSSVAKT